MLASLFRSNQPAVLLAVPVLVGVLFGAQLFAPIPPRPMAMPLVELVDHLIGGSAWARNALSLLLVMAVSVQLAMLVNDMELMDRRNHFPAFLFPVLLAALGPHVLYGPALLGMPLVIAALRRTWSISNHGQALGALFDAGSLLGIASLFYLPYAFLVVVVWASVSVIRPFQWREYVLPLFGCAWVFYVAWGVLRLLGLTPWHPLFTIAHDQGEALPNVMWRIALYVVLAMMLLVAAVVFARSYQRSVMRGKNLRSGFLAFMAALGVVIGFVRLLGGDVHPVLMAVPLGVFAGNALTGARRNWLSETACYALLALALVAQWG